MYSDKIVLCGSNAYEQKYYLNPDFEKLPESIKEELRIMCVLFTNDVGGILTLEYQEDGSLMFNVMCDEGDLLFDEIGCELKMKQIQQTRQDLLSSLEMYFKVFILGEDVC